MFFMLKRNTYFSKRFCLKHISSNCNGCEVRIEKFVTSVTVRHHEACQVMPKSYPEWRYFQHAAKHPYGFVFSHTLPSRIAFKQECVFFFVFFFFINFTLKYKYTFHQEMVGSVPNINRYRNYSFF